VLRGHLNYNLKSKVERLTTKEEKEWQRLFDFWRHSEHRTNEESVEISHRRRRL